MSYDPTLFPLDYPSQAVNEDPLSALQRQVDLQAQANALADLMMRRQAIAVAIAAENLSSLIINGPLDLAVVNSGISEIIQPTKGTKSYLYGGFESGGLSSGQTRLLTFATESMSITGTSLLYATWGATSNIGTPAKGYLIGGTGAVSQLNPALINQTRAFSVDISSGARSLLGATLTPAVTSATSCNSPAAGYILGGGDSFTAPVPPNLTAEATNNIRKIIFANETIATISPTLTVKKSSAIGFSNGAIGFVVGGCNPFSSGSLPLMQASVNKMTFSNETISALGDFPFKVLGSQMGPSSLTKAFVIGGFGGFGGDVQIMKNVYRILYADSTYQDLGQKFGTPRSIYTTMTGTPNTYLMNPIYPVSPSVATQLNQLDRLSVISETAAELGIVPPTGDYYGSAFGDWNAGMG